MGNLDPETVVRLWDEHAAPLTLYARQWCEQPEDVVQEAFLLLVRQAVAPENPVGWLYRVVRNRAINAARSRDRRTRRETEAAAPRPALKYQLLPPFLERRPGNAVVHYLKLPHEQNYLYSNGDIWVTLEKWSEMSLPELRKAFAADGGKHTWIVSSQGSIWEFLERGSRCESADWDLPIREHEF